MENLRFNGDLNTPPKAEFLNEIVDKQDFIKSGFH
jgi:hypothetical protein